MNVKPILKYPGAKWQLAPWIVQYLPRMPHYVEPYCGSAAVYFNLPWRPKHAVLNDLSGDIVNLFRVIREHGDELAAMVEMTPFAREEFELSFQDTDDPIERARRYLVRVNQGGPASTYRRTGWRNNPRSLLMFRVPSMQWTDTSNDIRRTIAALQGVEIEHYPAIELIERVKYSHVLLYCDPPYVSATRTGGRLYQHEMTEFDHITLLDALSLHPGPVVLSGYHCPLYDDRLRDWTTVKTQTQAEKNNVRTEVLWLNEKAAQAQQIRMDI